MGNADAADKVLTRGDVERLYSEIRLGRSVDIPDGAWCSLCKSHLAVLDRLANAIECKFKPGDMISYIHYEPQKYVPVSALFLWVCDVGRIERVWGEPDGPHYAFEDMGPLPGPRAESECFPTQSEAQGECEKRNTEPT